MPWVEYTYENRETQVHRLLQGVVKADFEICQR